MRITAAISHGARPVHPVAPVRGWAGSGPRGVLRRSSRDALRARLMRSARGDPNDVYIAQMAASWRCGDSAMPRFMGLPPSMFLSMMTWHFGSGAEAVLGPRGRHGVAQVWGGELDDLRQLLLANRAGRSRSERWMAELICAGCTASDHLWSDLGLVVRKDLTTLMNLNFPTLARRNTQNMRWKKFLYKRLCESEGLYICRAPSCEVCSERSICFAPAIEGL